MNNQYFSDDDLIYNTASRVPVCLCIDTSGSMNQKDSAGISRINRVIEGIKRFYKELEENEMTRYSAEVAIVGFSTEPYVVQDFKTIDYIDAKNVNLIPNGQGDLGLGVLKSLELLKKRKAMYNENGIDYYQPWLIIMSDGKPTGNNCFTSLAEAQKNTVEMEDNKKLTVIPVFIGKIEDGKELKEIDSKADKYLSDFSKKNPPLQLSSGQKFSDFFEWLGKSVSAASVSSDVELDFAKLTDWDSI